MQDESEDDLSDDGKPLFTDYSSCISSAHLRVNSRSDTQSRASSRNFWADALEEDEPAPGFYERNPARGRGGHAKGRSMQGRRRMPALAPLRSSIPKVRSQDLTAGTHGMNSFHQV